jgi:hypothetical protein
LASRRSLRASAMPQTIPKEMERAPASRPDSSTAQRVGSPTSLGVGRGGGGDESGEGVSHAKLSSDVEPLRIEAVLRRKGEIVFVTSEGKHRVEFSEKARGQLAKILSD